MRSLAQKTKGTSAGSPEWRMSPECETFRARIEWADELLTAAYAYLEAIDEDLAGRIKQFLLAEPPEDFRARTEWAEKLLSDVHAWLQPIDKELADHIELFLLATPRQDSVH